LVCVYALREIEDGEELFLDYVTNNLIDINFMPDWLKRAPPICKFWIFSKIIKFSSLFLKGRTRI